jgi:hypothetical protein
MGFGHHPRNLNCWMAIKNRFWLPSKKSWSLNDDRKFSIISNWIWKRGHLIFLESSCWTLCMATEGNWKFNRQWQKIAFVDDRKMVLVALLLVTKNFWSPYEWQLKMDFGCHPKNLNHWMATKNLIASD